MIRLVNMMEGASLNIDKNHERMDMYWQSDQWVLEPMEKGRRYQCIIENGVISFFTKSEKSCSRSINGKIPHIVESIIKKIPDQSLIDGYITIQDEIKTLQILESSVDNALRLQKKGKLDFVISDIVYWNDDQFFELPLFDRRKKIEEIQEDEHLKISKNFINDKYNVYQNLRSDYDVFYFKDLDSPYIFGKSSMWKILKEPQSFYVTILDVLEGKGKFENMAGSLAVGQNRNGKMTYITNIAGLNGDDRIIFFQNKEKYINKVIEIKALKRTINKFSEARFYKLREDLDPSICI